MIPYFFSCILLLYMTPFCIQACKEVSVVQQPNELDVDKTAKIQFTCAVYSDCKAELTIVEKNGINVAYLTPQRWVTTNCKISGNSTYITVTFQQKIRTADLGIYYCKASVQTGGEPITVSGSGTHLYSGGPPLDTNAGMVVITLWACAVIISRVL